MNHMMSSTNINGFPDPNQTISIKCECGWQTMTRQGDSLVAARRHRSEVGGEWTPSPALTKAVLSAVAGSYTAAQLNQ